jgi:hypothetical protein
VSHVRLANVGQVTPARRLRSLGAGLLLLGWTASALLHPLSAAADTTALANDPPIPRPAEQRDDGMLPSPWADGEVPRYVRTPPAPPLAWGAVVSPAFRVKVRQVCENLGCAPDHLMAAIALETMETFSPSVRNSQSGATGLIQFLESTAQELGTTTDELAGLSAVDQLRFVERYFDRYRGRVGGVEDLYLAILWPRAVGQPLDFELFAEGEPAYEQNSHLDLDQDGVITKAEAAAHVTAKLAKGRLSHYMG